MTKGINIYLFLFYFPPPSRCKLKYLFQNTTAMSPVNCSLTVAAVGFYTPLQTLIYKWACRTQTIL